MMPCVATKRPLQVEVAAGLFEWLSQDELRCIVDQVHEDDALALALTGSRFRTAVFCRFPEPANGGPRLRTWIGSAVSIARLRWNLSQSCPIDHAIGESLASRGNLDTLQFAIGELSLPTDTGITIAAARANRLEVLQWAHGEGYSLTVDACKAAARAGHLEVLLWARSLTDTDPAIWEGEGMCTAAAIGGHLDVLQWLRGQGRAWDETVCAAAAQEGHLALLQWAREQGAPWDIGEIIMCASEGGHLDLLAWVREESPPGPLDSQEPWAHACVLAAAGGHLRLLEWLYPFAEWRPEVYLAAAANGHLDILQWAWHRHPLDAILGEAILNAAAGGHLRCVQWLHGVQGGWGPFSETDAEAVIELWGAAAISGNVEMLSWMLSNACRRPPGSGGSVSYRTLLARAVVGGLPTLQWMRASAILPENLAALAPLPGYALASVSVALLSRKLQSASSKASVVLEIKEGLRWIDAQHPTFISHGWELARDAAELGDVELLRVLHERGCEFTGGVFAAAARSGRASLRLLRFLLAVGCPWNAGTCLHAARAGNLWVLQWLRSHGCPWDSRTIDEAGSKEVQAWAIVHRTKEDDATRRTRLEGSGDEMR